MSWKKCIARSVGVEMMPTMKSIRILLAFGLLLGLSSVLQAGTLTFAVLQFSSLVEEGELREALAGESLRGVTGKDRMDSRNALLRNVPILFSQEVRVARGSGFANTTRLGAQQATVEGRVADSISLQVTLSEGVDAGLRRFSQSVYRGEGALVSGRPQVLSLRQVDSRTQTAQRGRPRMVTNQFTIALVYQFQP